MPFIDARDVPSGREIVADLVVVGAGLAGIAIARSWAGSGFTVALLESGGRQRDAAVQDLYAGSAVVRGPDDSEMAIDAYLTSSRIRALGGSGAVWGGKCVPLDEADFRPRQGVPHSGWPMTRRELSPYYDRASDLLGVPRLHRAGAAEADPGRRTLPMRADRFFSAPRAYSRFSGAFDAPAFESFRTSFAAPAEVTVWLNLNVTEIRLSADARSVDRLELATLDGRRHTARARAYVLAAGGIENARLMLASTSVRPEGVGNGAGLVGRFFQGHALQAVHAEGEGASTGVVLTRPADMSLYVDAARTKTHCVVASTLGEQRRLKAGNFTVTLQRAAEPSARATLNAIHGLAASLDGGGSTPPKDSRLACYFMSEHLPNPESRVTLGRTSDALGMPRTRLEWRYAPADWRNLERSVAAFASDLGAQGLGRVCFPLERAAFLSATQRSNHHMGTTRMDADPERGVVDPDGRVHGLANLYVAGSSVFPTSGIANPTLTLVALALRLTDHLRSKMRRAA
jgi:choline dehydrogenase-like flavoprotein